MNATHRDQAECANFSSASVNGTQLLPWLPEVASCKFWIIVHSEGLLHVSVVLIWTLFLFSLLVNIYLLIRPGDSEALSWQPRRLQLRSLTMSALLNSMALAPLILYCLYSRHTLSFSGLCVAQFFASAMAIIASLLTVASMTLERYVYTCHAIRYLTIMTNSRMYISVFFIWLTALMGAGISTVLALRGGNKFGHAMSGFVCEPSVMQAQIEQPLCFEKFNKAFIECLLLFCLLVFSFSYSRMYQVARQMQELFQQDNARAREAVASYFGIFVLQLVPSMIKLITLFGKGMDNHLLLSVLVLVPPCFSPLIYGIRNKEVQQSLQCLWGSIKKKLFPPSFRSAQQVAVTSVTSISNISTSTV